MLEYFLKLERYKKRIVSLFVDTFLLMFCFWLSYWIRLDNSFPIQSEAHWFLAISLTIVSLFVFIRIGLYRAVLRYVSFKVLLTVLAGISFSTLFLILSAFIFDIFLPRSTAILYFSFTFMLVGGVRLFFRMTVYQLQKSSIGVLIYGAGASGRQLQVALNQSSEYMPLFFVDDDERLRNSNIQGLRVHTSDNIVSLVERYAISKVLLALPSVAKSRRQEILQRLEPLPCEVLSIPSSIELISGKASIDELKDVSIEDLLGRDEVPPNKDLLCKNIKDKVVLVSGAGGSIGSELCRQILSLKPKILILLDHSEYSLYEIDKELNSLNIYDSQILPILGSIQNKSKLSHIFEHYQISTIFHAAAYKHVPMVEYNIVEGIRNNVFGTLNMAEAAIKAKVSSFVLVSTDKAVRPTNVMGASKRLSELILQALSNEDHSTVFSMVRFGNVLGSSGSVVPLFRKQIAEKGVVTVTHPEITRYFMTIPEASQLVIQAGAMSKGGDVYVLDMGEPIKIADLAVKMINLSGLTVKKEGEGDVEIEFTGLRPGEKLYEELLIGSNATGTCHDRVMCANEDMLPWGELELALKGLAGACEKNELRKIRDILLSTPLGYQPSSEICDLVWRG